MAKKAVSYLKYARAQKFHPPCPAYFGPILTHQFLDCFLTTGFQLIIGNAKCFLGKLIKPEIPPGKPAM